MLWGPIVLYSSRVAIIQTSPETTFCLGWNKNSAGKEFFTFKGEIKNVKLICQIWTQHFCMERCKIERFLGLFPSHWRSLPSWFVIFVIVSLRPIHSSAYYLMMIYFFSRVFEFSCVLFLKLFRRSTS